MRLVRIKEKSVRSLITGIAVTAVTIFMLTGAFPSQFPVKEFIVGSAVAIVLEKYLFGD